MNGIADGRKRSRHIGTYSGQLVDYNGVGRWSADAIRERYLEYAAGLGVKPPAHLVARLHTEGDRTWRYPLMDEVIRLIEAGDAAAIEIGIEFIEEDDFFAFGMILKSNTARAHARCGVRC